MEERRIHIDEHDAVMSLLGHQWSVRVCLVILKHIPQIPQLVIFRLLEKDCLVSGGEGFPQLPDQFVDLIVFSILQLLSKKNRIKRTYIEEYTRSLNTP